MCLYEYLNEMRKNQWKAKINVICKKKCFSTAVLLELEKGRFNAQNELKIGIFQELIKSRKHKCAHTMTS